MSDDFSLPENYYRVSLKALIFDEKQRILVGRHANGTYAMPGGGWDHGEDYESCLRREIVEELGVEVVSIGNVTCFYRTTIAPGNLKVVLAFPVGVANFDFILNPDSGEAVEMYFVSKHEFARLNFMQEESAVLDHIDQIWAVVEKNDKNK